MFTGVKWKFQTNGRVISSPAVENGLVYVGSMDKNLYGHRPTNRCAQVEVYYRRSGGIFSGAGGIVYFASYDGKS
jgi:outer membrane protein assembly factor BamB